MYWWKSVETALGNLGGVATLKDLYVEVRSVRLSSGDTMPGSIEAVVRKELEYNSSDSSNWRGDRNLFFSVHGVGKGVWGLRSQLEPEPSASDLAPPEPEEDGASEAPISEVTVNRIIRDTEMARKIKALHHSECQICGLTIHLTDGRPYAEAHHVIPLGRPHKGPDIPSNIIVVCPNHHAMLDLGCIPLNPSELREVPGHKISTTSINYHNDQIVPRMG
ncbi:hypothetical protein FHS66_001331 [Pacificitalea manganoxidans]|nr:hypothetical protein [Pacificitalea manganoxidans]